MGLGSDARQILEVLERQMRIHRPQQGHRRQELLNYVISLHSHVGQLRMAVERLALFVEGEESNRARTRR